MQSLKLKSKTLIDFFGKDTIEIEELDDLNELIILGNGTTIDKQEATLLQDDLSTFFKFFPTMMEFRLDNIDMSNISIARILKECSASEISFDGSDKYFSQLRNTTINLSDLTIENLGLDAKQEISEFDMFEQLKTAKQFSLSPTIDIEDLETALKYIDIFEIKIKVRTQNDLEKILDLSNNSNILIDVDINDLKSIPEIPTLFTVDISVSDMSELSLDDIESLEKHCNLGRVSIQQESNGNLIGGFGDAISRGAEIYDIDIYKQLKNEINLITNGIDKESPDIEKFLEIYKRLGNKISYDWEHKDIDGENGTIYLGGYPPAHNLVGGLLNNTCVCEGYAKILKQALACVGIQAKVILGSGQEEPHAWNQVNIDGTWYNTDLTWDADKIKEGRELDYCLQSDSEFINHSTESIITEQCNNSFDRNKINQYLGIPFAFDFEEKDYSVTEMISLIQEVNSYAISGTRIGINRNFSTGDYKLILGNIIDDDSIRWSESEITLTSKNLADFIKEYSNTFQVKDKDTSGTVDFIKTNESIELVVDESLKSAMQDYGIDIDELLSPREENDMHTIDTKTATSINSILAGSRIELDDTDLKQENINSLVEYKPSIWSRMINSLKNRLERIQKAVFRKKNIEEKDEQNNILSTGQEQTSKQTKQLPSWDLRNWSSEELEFYAVQAKREQSQKGISVQKEDDLLAK